MSTYPMPEPETVGTVMGDLIGKDVSVAEGEPFPLDPKNAPFSIVLFRDDNGYPGAVMICDLASCVYSGAALTLMRSEEAQMCVKKKELDDAMYENFKEVVNIVGGTLFNSASSPHLVLREIWYCPTTLGKDLQKLFTEPSERLDIKISVEDYGDGKLTLLVV
ncbi:MAG: hypothetical protein ABIK28_10565 [Planctomycetota bacterium]